MPLHFGYFWSTFPLALVFIHHYLQLLWFLNAHSFLCESVSSVINKVEQQYHSREAMVFVLQSASFSMVGFMRTVISQCRKYAAVIPGVISDLVKY